jgi:CheY-like chemotaxis protein/anti-sigma regulatory factor (Ser/Thr protein kinase)
MEQTPLDPSEGRRGSESRDLEDLQSTFIRNAGHELRTPLAILQGYAELLRDGELGDLAPEQQQALFVIVDRAYALRTLVDRIGTLMEVQASTDVSIPFTLAEVAAKAVYDRRAAAAQAGLTLETRLESGLPPVAGNPHQLRHALDCLLENAIKFTPGGGRIEVQVYVESGWVCCTVTDTGIGIPEDKLEHLFTGFYQVDGSTTRRYGGIGLGLTVAKMVVQAHAGRIEVESHPGQGSRFTVRLPMLSSKPQTDQPVGSLAMMRRILVVDDEENVALTLQAGLERLPNCEVTVATSGEQALQLFEQQPFDLVVTDYKMPGTDGMMLAARIRQKYPETAIVMITAYSSDELREQAARASIQHILDKPVKLTEVRSAALEALSRSEG